MFSLFLSLLSLYNMHDAARVLKHINQWMFCCLIPHRRPDAFALQCILLAVFSSSFDATHAGATCIDANAMYSQFHLKMKEIEREEAHLNIEHTHKLIVEVVRTFIAHLTDWMASNFRVHRLHSSGVLCAALNHTGLLNDFALANCGSKHWDAQRAIFAHASQRAWDRKQKCDVHF